MRISGIMWAALARLTRVGGGPILGSVVVVFALSLKRSGDCLPEKPLGAAGGCSRIQNSLR